MFGLVLAHGYGAALTPALQNAGLPEAAQAALELQRAKLAGSTVPADLSPDQQAAAMAAIKSAFISGYRWAMVVAAPWPGSARWSLCASSRRVAPSKA